MSEIKINEEALLCSHREESHSHPHGYHVQMLLNQRDAELAELRQAAKDFIWNVEHNHVAGWGDCSRDVRADASYRELKLAALRPTSQAVVKGGEK